MGIQTGDIKLVASQVMDDVDEGGGAPTSTVIVDGTSNSIFKDISELDRGGGRVNLRKLLVSVQTPDTDTYLGANVIVADPPADPNVSVTIFKTSDTFDRRTNAQDRVEAYLNKAGLWEGYLMENHIAGQRSIQIFHRSSVKPPVVGKTLYLVANEGLSSQYYQYVRVIKVESESREFTVAVNGNMVDFTAAVSTCTLSDALLYDFPGSAPSRFYTMESGKTKIRDTLVADAAQYYGAVKTTAPVAVGAYKANVDSIFTKIVPSAQTETGLVDQPLAGTALPMVAASAGTVTASVVGASFANGAKYVLPTGCYPGSLSLTIGGVVITDDGLGNVLQGTSTVGSINYTTGEISFSALSGTTTGTCTETYRPAAGVSMQAYTLSRPVTAENRAYVWVIPLTPIPSPGSLVISYMAQGDWYELTDNGLGAIKGLDSAYGVGTISYVTGTLNVTLGALPDVGSEIIVSWGTPQEFLNLSDSALNIAAPKIEFDLGGVSPGTLIFAWTVDGATKTASDNGSGTLTGDATGAVSYGSGKGWLRPGTLPSSGSISVNYDTGGNQLYSATVGGGATWSATLPSAPIKPKSIAISFQQAIVLTEVEGRPGAAVSSWNQAAAVHDDGAGNLVLAGYGTLPGASINYSTGQIVLAVNQYDSRPVATYQTTTTASAGGVNNPGQIGITYGYSTFSGYANAGITRSIAPGGIAVRYALETDPAESSSVPIESPYFTLDLSPTIGGAIVAGSLRFRLGSYTYIDRAGKLYRSVDRANGSGFEAGTINYQTGQAKITNWASGSPAFTLESGLINPGTPGVSVVLGRTASVPLKSQSFYISATALDGTQLSAVSNADGTLTGTQIAGTIDTETGIYRLAFGQLIGGEWQSTLVDPSTLRYNAVAYSYLPLDANIIGLDPVRLPQDGRVPIFRAGSFAVLGHTGKIGPVTVSNGQTVNCARVRLSRVRVIGNDGNVINTGYSADLEAGTVAFSDVSGYAQPVTIEHRIEDMVQVSDVQINGQLTFTRQISHDYPTGSIMSSALIIGDMKARVPVLFDQSTWSGAWSDSVSGSVATATYNDVLSPIEVTNEGATNERWVIQFTNTTSFNVIGEHVGVIATGNTATDLSPTNPATGKPYFTLRAAGWGSGWSAGNALRFNTVGALYPVWVIRTIQQGAETIIDDAFTLLIRGDVDRA